MEKIFSLDPALADELWVRVVAQELQKFCKATGEEQMHLRVDSEAVQVLSEIKKVLDDPFLDDPECFYRIDTIPKLKMHCRRRAEMQR